MKAEFTIKNYRCFDEAHPLRFTLEDGFTAFVGPNNSGKSSILKFFHEFRNIWGLMSQPVGNIVQLTRGASENLSFLSVIDPNEVFCDTNNREITIEVNFGYSAQNNMVNLLKVVFYIYRPNSIPGQGNIVYKADFFVAGRNAEKVVGAKGFTSTDLKLADDRDLNMAPFFETFGALFNSVYFPSFRNMINVGGGSYFDINIGTGFISQWHDWSVGPNKAQNAAMERITEDIRNIFRFDKLKISANKDLNTFQIDIDGRQYKLQEIGSGIAQFVLVFGNAAVRQPSFIMIDEPEISLHPSLQQDFLSSLTAYSKKGVLFATHSIGLARAIADKVYSVRLNGRDRIVSKYEQTGNLAEFLGELSFSSFSELGFKKILLVEGVTEVKTIQQFLRLLKKDHEIVLLPLGGDSMISGSQDVTHELSELKRISSQIYALIDSERASKDVALAQNREAFREVCKKRSIDICVLERRATENYLTEKAIKQVKGEKYQQLAPYQKLNETSPSWSKAENWRIAREMSLNDLKGTDLHDFLERM